jgi:hypothetical protein
VIALYAVIDHPTPPLPDVAPLRTVAHDGLALVCGATADATEVSPELLWQHEEVVEALMEDRDLLPVRYGTRVEDEAAAVQVLRERCPELANALDRVRGAVELSVRALGEGEEQVADPAEAASGTDYMRAQARAAAAQASTLNAVHEPLSLLARASMQRPQGGAGDLLRSAYLVDRHAVRRFIARVRELDRALPTVRLLCTGPWPPYSFTEP